MTCFYAVSFLFYSTHVFFLPPVCCLIIPIFGGRCRLSMRAGTMNFARSSYELFAIGDHIHMLKMWMWIICWPTAFPSFPTMKTVEATLESFRANRPTWFRKHMELPWFWCQDSCALWMAPLLIWDEWPQERLGRAENRRGSESSEANSAPSGDPGQMALEDFFLAETHRWLSSKPSKSYNIYNMILISYLQPISCNLMFFLGKNTPMDNGLSWIIIWFSLFIYHISLKHLKMR